MKPRIEHGTRGEIETQLREAGFRRTHTTTGLPTSETWEADGRRVVVICEGYGRGAAAELREATS